MPVYLKPILKFEFLYCVSDIFPEFIHAKLPVDKFAVIGVQVAAVGFPLE